MKEASLVIPFYNEENTLPKTLKKVEEFVKKSNLEWEVIFVNDGSRDNSLNILKNYKKKFFKIISYSQNKGKGEAVKKGILKSKGDIVIFTDSDLAYSLNYIGAIIKELEGYEVVIGSRRLNTKPINASLVRKTLGVGFNILSRIILKLPYKDMQAGIKGFKKDAAKKIFNLQTIPGFAFDVELVFLAKENKLSIKEIPVEISKEHSFKDTKVKVVNDSAKMFANLIKIRLNKLKGIYSRKNFSKVADYYDRMSGNYQKKFSQGFLSKLRTKERKSINDLLNPKKGDKILDAGCGSGFDAVPLKNLGAEVYGIDISPKMVKIANERGINAQTGNLEDFNLNKKFDKILCSGAFEFCQNHDKILINFKNHLKKEGHIVILYSRKSLMGQLFKLFHLATSKINIKTFSEGEMKRLMHKSGLKIISLEKPHSFAGVIKLK